ncbi:hypothetical protein GGI11_003714 [Coemansia sp. RSA 2049]|nr:hypothetical protein GGI11_003714 [Coemansia sp. RSA 2049]
MANGRRLSAGALNKERHVARNGCDIRAPIKKGGNGNHNWGTGLHDPLEWDVEDAMAVSPPSVSKVSLASREDFERSKQENNMQGYPTRNAADINTSYPYLFDGSPTSQPMCNPKQQSSPSAYTANLPMAVAQPGETIYTTWEANGHLNNAAPTNVKILYYADSTKEFTSVNERSTAAVAGSFNYAANANCFNPSEPNTTCVGSWVVPKNLVPGKTYHFVWFWYFNANPAGQWYSTCFDMQIKDSSHVVKTAAMADIMKLGDPPVTYSNGLDSKAKDLIAQTSKL